MDKGVTFHEAMEWLAFVGEPDDDYNQVFRLSGSRASIVLSGGKLWLTPEPMRCVEKPYQPSIEDVLADDWFLCT